MSLRPWMIRAGYALALIALLALAAHAGTIHATIEAGRRVGAAILLLSVGVTAGSMLISGVVWTRVLHCLGCRASLRVGLALYVGTGLASYLGAGAGAAGQCVLLLRPHGVGAGRSIFLLVLASLVGFLGAMAWAPCGVVLLAGSAAAHALPAVGSRGPVLALVATLVFGLGALAVLVLLALAPRLGLGTRLVRAVAGRSSHPIHLPVCRLLALIPYAALAWGVSAGALWLLVRAAVPSATLSLPAAIGIQTMATVVGSATFFLPNGLGARDGALVSLLVAIAGVPLPAAVAVAALIRASDPASKILLVLALALWGRLSVPVERLAMLVGRSWRRPRLVARTLGYPWPWVGRASRTIL